MTKSRDLANVAQSVATSLPTSIGTAGQVVQVNSGANGLEFADASGGGGGGSYQATASGAIADGDPIVVNTNGTVSKVSESISLNASAQTSMGNLEDHKLISLTGHTDSANKVIFIYKQGSNPTGRIYARLATLSVSGGTPTITALQEIAFTSNQNGSLASDNDFQYGGGSWDSVNQRGLLLYGETTHPYGPYLTTYSLTNAGSTLTPNGQSHETGLTSIFEAGYVSTVFDPNIGRHIMIGKKQSYYELVAMVINTDAGSANYAGGCRDGNIGTLDTGFSGGPYSPRMVYDPDTHNIIGASKGAAGGAGVIRWFCGKWDNTTGSSGALVGSAVGQFPYTGGDLKFGDVTYDTNANKVFFVWSKTDGIYGTVATVSSSGYNLTLETAVKISDEDSVNSQYGSAFNCEFNPTDGKIYIEYKTYENGLRKLKMFTVQISGSTVSSDTPVHANNVSAYNFGARYNNLVYQPDSQMLVRSFYNNQSSIYALAQSYNYSASSNLTTTNFIGLSDAAYSDSATATIQTAGAVDDAQSGLTVGAKYYLNSNGSLQTGPSSPSVEVGTAVAATKIIVKG